MGDSQHSINLKKVEQSHAASAQRDTLHDQSSCSTYHSGGTGKERLNVEGACAKALGCILSMECFHSQKKAIWAGMQKEEEDDSTKVEKAGRGQTCKVLGTFKEVDLCLKSHSHCIMSFKCFLLVPCSCLLKSRIEMVDRQGSGQRPVSHSQASPTDRQLLHRLLWGMMAPVAHTPA